MMILKTQMRKVVYSCILFMPTDYRSWSELFWCPKFFTLAFCSFIWSFFNAPICPTSKCLAYNMERRGGTITLSQNPCSLQWSLTERSDWLMKVWPSIFDITSFQAETLISPHYNDGGFLPITPLRQDSHLLDITQIKRTDHLSLLSLLYTLHRSCVKSLRTHCQTSQRVLQAPTSYSARLHSVCMNRGSNLHLVCAMCMSKGSSKTVFLFLLECCADHSWWSLTIQIVTKHNCNS